MNIYSIIPNSFIDYPPYISAVVFSSGCNLNCWYCHNKEIIQGQQTRFSEKYFFDFLNERKNFIEAVVVSGGEPTLQPDLIDFLQKIKNLGFKVKLDSNGFNLECLKQIAAKNLIDYLAIDIKAPAKKYKQICGVDISEEKLNEIINCVENLKIDFEFRTTFSPDLTEEDILQIAKLLDKKDKYFIQQYRANCETDPKQHLDEFVYKVSKNVENVLPNVKVRGLLIDK